MFCCSFWGNDTGPPLLLAKMLKPTSPSLRLQHAVHPRHQLFQGVLAQKGRRGKRKLPFGGIPPLSLGKNVSFSSVKLSFLGVWRQTHTAHTDNFVSPILPSGVNSTTVPQTGFNCVLFPGAFISLGCLCCLPNTTSSATTQHHRCASTAGYLFLQPLHTVLLNKSHHGTPSMTCKSSYGGKDSHARTLNQNMPPASLSFNDFLLHLIHHRTGWKDCLLAREEATIGLQLVVSISMLLLRLAKVPVLRCLVSCAHLRNVDQDPD